MKVRALDKNHDWELGKGMASYLNNSEAIAQCVKTKILMLKNDWFLGESEGISWFDYLDKNPDLTTLESEIKTAVTSVAGVTMITSFDVLLDSETRVIKIELAFNDIYNNRNEVNVNVTD